MVMRPREWDDFGTYPTHYTRESSQGTKDEKEESVVSTDDLNENEVSGDVSETNVQEESL